MTRRIQGAEFCGETARKKRVAGDIFGLCEYGEACSGAAHHPCIRIVNAALGVPDAAFAVISGAEGRPRLHWNGNFEPLCSKFCSQSIRNASSWSRCSTICCSGGSWSVTLRLWCGLQQLAKNVSPPLNLPRAPMATRATSSQPSRLRCQLLRQGNLERL